MTETLPRPRGAEDLSESKDPLLLCAPLRIEARAIRRGLRAGGLGPAATGGQASRVVPPGQHSLPDQPAVRRAVAWLESRQNPDGGWGEDLRSYDDPALAGRGTSTASQTAWALLALLAAGEQGGAAVERGIRWLAQTQRADGSWDEPQYTGTGFPGDFYINYHLYRLAFPLSALGRYVAAHTSGGSA